MIKITVAENLELTISPPIIGAVGSNDTEVIRIIQPPRFDDYTCTMDCQIGNDKLSFAVECGGLMVTDLMTCKAGRHEFQLVWYDGESEIAKSRTAEFIVTKSVYEGAGGQGKDAMGRLLTKAFVSSEITDDGWLLFRGMNGKVIGRVPLPFGVDGTLNYLGLLNRPTFNAAPVEGDMDVPIGEITNLDIDAIMI